MKLPDVHDLVQFIDSPLSKEEKIPITWKEMDLLVSSQSVGMIDNFCNRSDVELLFRVANGSGSSGSDFHDIIFTVRRDSPIQGTEEFFISFWDRNVRDILEFFLLKAYAKARSTLLVLLEFCALVMDFFSNVLGRREGSCRYRGSKERACDKLTWAYRPAPYVFGR